MARRKNEIERFQIAASQVAKLMHDSMIDGHGWEEDKNNLRMVFRAKASIYDNSPFGGYLMVNGEGEPPIGIYSDASALEVYMKPLRDLAERFDTLRSDIHDILQLHWLEHRDDDGYAEIHLADIMRYRDVELWKGTLRDEDVQRYSTALRDVIRPAIEGIGTAWLKTGRRAKQQTIRYTGPIWMVKRTVDYPKERGAGLIESIYYQPGEWLKSVIDPYVPMIMQRTPLLLKLDAKQENHKKIGKALDYYYRVNPGKPVRISMRALLEGARIEITDRDKRLIGEFIDRIEKALEDLYALGVLGYYSPTRILQDLPPRGKLEAWLKTIYTFEPMPEIQQQYQTILEGRVKAIEHSSKAGKAARKRTPQEGES